MTRVSVFAFVLFISPGLAQEWAFHDADRLLSRAEVEALVSGQTITFYDEGRSNYATDGSYRYTYASGASAHGHYEIRADGTVCVRYRNGFARCDKYVQAGSRIVLLTEKGLRFPIKPAKE